MKMMVGLLLVILLMAGCVSGEPFLTEPYTSDAAQNAPPDTEPIITDAAQSAPPDTEPIITDAAQSAPPDTEPNTLLAAYKAYYKLIESLIDEYGVGFNKGTDKYNWGSELWWTVVYSGLIYAELIDFNKDGIPELLIIFNNGETSMGDLWAVYGYTGTVELYCEEYYGGDGGGTSGVAIALSSTGIRYLVYDDYYFVYDDEWEYKYYTVIDGSWDMVLSRSISITNESRQTGDFQWQWFVNDALVSENEYETAPEKELGIVSTWSIFYTRDPESLETKNKRASDYVYTLLAELENRILQLEK